MSTDPKAWQRKAAAEIAALEQKAAVQGAGVWQDGRWLVIPRHSRPVFPALCVRAGAETQHTVEVRISQPAKGVDRAFGFALFGVLGAVLVQGDSVVLDVPVSEALARQMARRRTWTNVLVTWGAILLVAACVTALGLWVTTDLSGNLLALALLPGGLMLLAGVLWLVTAGPLLAVHHGTSRGLWLYGASPAFLKRLPPAPDSLLDDG
jgi:hypothetical protein